MEKKINQEKETSNESKIVLASIWQPAPHVPQDINQPIIKLSDFVADEYGRYTIGTVGEYDFNQVVEAARPGCTLKELLASVTRTGDASILKTHPGVYADITRLPQDNFELSQLRQDNAAAAAALGGLPDELQAPAGVSVQDYILTDEFMQKFQTYLTNKAAAQVDAAKGE